ncbi:DUF1802 family protein [Paenibacillus septentrionalis]|uniref:DUF1802 family protein n=1 Tax=Paenibacillus septentrionalis TaxID=429342 RepID=A0ABW1V1J7_9BACL
MLNQETVAFKEWAVTVDSLLKGELIFVLRKGGIVEETKHFELSSHQFYLMPAYEHQKEHLLKEPYQGRIAGTMNEWSPDQSHMKLQGYAEVVEDILIHDLEKLHAVSELHIWTEQFAEERLKWKKTQPLHLIVLRVYRLDEPLMTTMQDAYRGCKSWVSIEEHLPERKFVPVLSDEEFRKQYEKLKQALSI